MITLKGELDDRLFRPVITLRGELDDRLFRPVIIMKTQPGLSY